MHYTYKTILSNRNAFNQLLIDITKDAQFSKMKFRYKKCEKIRSYHPYPVLKSEEIILDQEKRKEIILKKMNKVCDSRNLQNNFNEKLIQEVVNLVEKPNVILCNFDEIYLKIPQEILIVTMQHHQKYFPLFDSNHKLTNLFLLKIAIIDFNGLPQLRS